MYILDFSLRAVGERKLKFKFRITYSESRDKFRRVYISELIEVDYHNLKIHDVSYTLHLLRGYSGSRFSFLFPEIPVSGSRFPVSSIKYCVRFSRFSGSVMARVV